MLMNTTFLEDSFLIKWQSRVIPERNKKCKNVAIETEGKGLLIVSKSPKD